MKALFDTDILIDYLNGIEQARREIALYPDALISQITWMEVMTGATPDEELQVRAFLERFTIIPIDRMVAEEAVKTRRRYRLRLPDAIFHASAVVHRSTLVTRNTKDFPKTMPGVRVPYEISTAP